MNSAAKIFDSIPENDLLSLFQDGEADAKRVIEILNYKKEDVASAASIPLASVRYDSKMPEILRERLTEWAVAIGLVANFFKDEGRTILWFSTPNPMLGGMRPKDMIKIGRFNKLHKFILTALSEGNGR